MEIWIGRDGERHGPYKEDDVRQWLRSGQVSRDDLAWHEGLADWQPLSALFPDEVRSAPPAADNPYSAPATPMQQLPRTTAAALEDYAGFWKRFAAWIIDALVLLIPSIIIYKGMGVIDAFTHYMAQIRSGVPLETAQAALKSVMIVPAAIVIVIGFAYYVLLESSKLQATLGKLALGIRVTDLDGRALGFTRCLIRNAVRLLDAIPVQFIGLIPLFAYVATAWTARKQGWHDMAAKALVLNGRASEFKPDQAASGNTFHA